MIAVKQLPMHIIVIGTKDIGEYKAVMVAACQRNEELQVVALGRNIAKAFEVSAWVERELGFKIMKTTTSMKRMFDRKNKNQINDVQHVEIILKNNGKHP